MGQLCGWVAQLLAEPWKTLDKTLTKPVQDAEMGQLCDWVAQDPDKTRTKSVGFGRRSRESKDANGSPLVRVAPSDYIQPTLQRDNIWTRGGPVKAAIQVVLAHFTVRHRRQWSLTSGQQDQCVGHGVTMTSA